MSIVGWLLILSGLFGLFTLWISIGDPMARQVAASNSLPAKAQILLHVVGISIDLFCGAGLLQGRNWARLLYVAWRLAAIAIGLAATPYTTPALISLAALAAVAFILFREPANVYFGRRYFGRPRRDATSTRKRARVGQA